MNPITLTFDQDGILQVTLGEGYVNSEIVTAAELAAKEIKNEVMGKVLKINGRQTVPVCYVLCHAFAHLVPAVAVFDPKLNGYVVVVVHGNQYKLGDVI